MPTRAGDSPRVAMLAALGRLQAARVAIGRGRYRDADHRCRDAITIVRQALESYHAERQQELNLSRGQG